MSDYERQFLADLEKAQALSLESLALEQYKQQRRLLADHSLSENEGDTPIRPTRSRSNSSGFPQPLPPPPRKPARRTLTSFHPEGVRSTSNSPTPCDAKVVDLISFNAPTSVEKSRMELKEQISQIHKLTHQADPSSLVPIHQRIPKLSHSNSSISTHSAQNIIPYHSNNSNLNYINPIIGFPSNFSLNQYQNPTPVLNVANSNQNYNTKISNIYNFDNAFSNKNNIGTTVNTLYPNLGNFQLNETNQHGYQFNNCKNVPASVPVDFPAPNQINTTFPDTNNTFPASTGIVEESSNKPNMVLNFTPPLVDNFNSNIIKSKSVEVNLMDTNYTSQTWNALQNPSNEIAKTTTTLDMKKSSSDINTSMSTKPLFWTSTTQPEKSINLIDLAANASNSNIKSQEASVLEAFDPLIADQSNTDYMFSSECSSSIYDEFDPLDYIYVEKRAKESPVYAVVNRDEKLSPVPSPAPKSLPPSTNVIKRDNALNKKLFETVVPIKTRKYDPELVAFLEMLIDVRAQYRYSDLTTNPGYVVALKSEGTYPNGTSIKLLVHFEDYSPITFTCDVESTVEHVIMHVVCELEGEIKKDISGYKLRVWGLSEYLTSGSSLREYAYVRQCVRLEKDVVLCLHSSSETRLSRTERDDIRDLHITLDRILPNQSSTPPISYHNLSILLETLERELSRVTTSVSDGTNVRIGSTAQAVKAICALLGGVQTVHVTNALDTLIHACNHSTPDSNYMKAEILSDAGDYSNVSLRQATLKDTVGLHCQRLRDAIRGFISLYCRVNRVDFELDENQYASPNDNDARKSSSLINETALFYIEAIHRLPVHWNHDDFVVHAQVYYGTRTLKGAQTTNPCYINTQGFYPKIMLETWLNLDDTPISELPKESRLVLTLIGRTLAHPENQPSVTEKDKATEAQESSEKSDKDISSNSGLIHVQQEELGWAAIQLFDFEGTLASGSFILPIWPMCADKRLGPAPDLTACPPQPHQLIHIEIPSYASGGVYWKDHQVDKNVTNANRHSFESLDKHTQQQLLHLVEQGPHQKMPSDCREVLWEKRHYLIEIPGALPLVLLASVNWDSVSKSQLLELLDHWKSPSPYDALHLLLPCFPDEGVRAKAVSWLSEASGNTLITLMPQLCLALRYERHVGSQLARLLLSRALESPRFAHRLYWQLVHDIPGNSPQNSSEESLGITLDNDFHLINEPDEGIVSTYRWVRRNQILLRALLEVVGANLAERLLKQQLLVKGITDVAHTVKKCKESVRNRNLAAGVNNLIPLVTSENVCLPLSISQEIYDIDTKTCSYFQSNTLPLKISFISSDKTIVPAIFKVGDDLRQDSLVLQVIRIMDQLWLKEGLDLSMVTFEAVPTHHKKGIIEMVCNAETLRSIQTEFGLTGSFKDKPIAEWLEKHNPSELEYERAVTNFTASCAGYSVATYLLGICDRHNDNIMLKTSGHLFHIDFGKFLGDAQMFGNFKRDRTPFVLTPDMAYVINGSDRPSRKFHHFVDLCCTAFNIVRKHHNLILNLFSLMASSGISGVSASSVGYVRAALLPGQTPAEAAATFARLIHSALKSKFTPINFFLHNLAQLRAGDQSASSSEILSFMPKTYTMEQDGRIINVEVTGCEKRYDPEKYYVYGLKTYREGQVTPFIIYRSYKHFCELYQKICLEHPLAKVHRVPVGLYMGRNNRQAAERRLADINAFVISLFKLADEIAHSKLVYTFFHPLLRDQQDISLQRVKPKTDNRQSMQNLEDSIGKLKISIQYSAGVLSVLILHAQSLPVTSAGPPSTYVKVYLKPDPSKETKRKTRVLRKNCHPSFMEMLEYRLPLEVIRGRHLEASVWHYDPLQENQELGGVIIPLHSMDLTVESTQWHPLQYIPR